MLLISNFYDKYVTYAKYLLILFLFWISINTGSKYVIFDDLYLNFTKNSFNFLRSILPYFILIYLLIFENNIFKKDNLKFDYFFVFFGLYGFFQISGLFYQFDNFYEHYWIVCLFSILLFYNLIKNHQNDKLIYTLYIANIILISIVFTIFIFITFKENLLSEHLLYNSRSFSIIYNTEQLPRSSGLSRMALILFIFANSLYFSNIPNFKNKNYLLIFNTILISIILLLQSRGALLGFVLIFFTWIIIFRVDNKLKYFISTILLPLLIFTSYPNLKNILIEKYGNVDTYVSTKQKTFKINNLEISLRPVLTTTEADNNNTLVKKISSISNNRLDAWNYLIQIFFYGEINNIMKKKLEKDDYQYADFKKFKKKNIFLGFGPQADRHLMYSKSKLHKSPIILGPFGQSASNAFIYSLVCSGIFGLICFIVINVIILFKILKIFNYNFKTKFLKSNPLLCASIFSILFLQFRCLFENSFSVFGVDLIIIITSYLIIQNEYRKLIS